MRSLMRVLPVAVFSVLAVASSAQARTAKCVVEIPGAGEAETSFDSIGPSLTLKTSVAGAPTVTTTLLSKDSACGVPVDVKTACKAQERESEQFGYDYTLVCGPSFSLDFYVDENGDGHTACTVPNGAVTHYETGSCQ